MPVLPSDRPTKVSLTDQVVRDYLRDNCTGKTVVAGLLVQAARGGKLPEGDLSVKANLAKAIQGLIEMDDELAGYQAAYILKTCLGYLYFLADKKDKP